MSIIDAIEAILARESWQADAACATADPEAWFPEKGANVSPAAKRICRTCPVIDECLEYALKHRERAGIWGGKSERERRQMIKELAA
ncbi:WhiB family transcriptional regulator [Mycolicibacterium conceptionense]|uniref:Transcriptional regulator WhiB n=1 Tax=Mycolicibacterium conceptionense TaxID=451644 RepID=A0A1A2V6W6_9MYCO|nr:WhiB family transcriptional regulator [Mycolicibacterium conceptionense]OBF14425.1 hypothetical protein A5726_25020 [Mycolicibacterium conceptionense]OBF31683.1 hypothetical protein A5720_28025 [Mycolicibacterium conceptionense]OBH97043.1 hypothetical protein A5716_16900 [Mycolicibacterium conceptionense]